VTGTPDSPAPLALRSGEFLLCGLLRCPRCDCPHAPGVQAPGGRYYGCACGRLDARSAELAVCLRAMLYTATTAPPHLRRSAAEVAEAWRTAQPREIRWMLRWLLTAVEAHPRRQYVYRWRHNGLRHTGLVQCDE
jgi:hypothetical protein